MNLILSAALIGGVISLAATVALGDYLTAFVVVILLLVVLRFVPIYLRLSQAERERMEKENISSGTKE